jgi:hypothetical protein
VPPDLRDQFQKLLASSRTIPSMSRYLRLVLGHHSSAMIMLTKAAFPNHGGRATSRELSTTFTVTSTTPYTVGTAYSTNMPC